MKLLRRMTFRTHSGIKINRTLVFLMAAFVLVFLSGCIGGNSARHESWPGLTLHEDVLYAANYDSIDAVNAESGKALWSYPSEDDENLGPFYATPVLAPDAGDYGVLFAAGFKDRTVYALALGESVAERPDEMWRNSEAEGQYVGSGIVAEGKFIIGNGDGNVYAFSIESGNIVWEFETQDRVWAIPAVEDGVVYIASLDHNFYAVDLETGGELWSHEFEAAIATTPVLDNGYAWVGDFSSKLHQIDLNEQTVAWSYGDNEVNDWVWATPLLVDRILYFTDVGGYVYALNVDSHEMVWDSPAATDDIVHGRPAINADGSRLFVPGYQTGYVFAIDTETGSVKAKWGSHLKTPGQLPGDLVADEAYLYSMPILTETRIKAFDLATGELLWPVATD